MTVKSFSRRKRGIVTKVTIEVQYPDGSKKCSTIDPLKEEIEAIFWSDRTVKEILASFYKVGNKKMTSEDVIKMWDVPESGSWEARPAVIAKQRSCRPTVLCKRCEIW